VLPSLADQISAELHTLRSTSRFRSCPALDGNSRVNVTLDGQELVSFCSNDYLGLSSDSRIINAANESAASGFGAGASRLVSGNLPVHIALENALADLVCLPAALLFPTGYQANLGVITALAGPEDLIVADRAVHASIIDACRLSRAKLAFYPHLDASAAERHLARLGHTRRRRFLVTESLFSMDGDVAPLSDLSSIASANDAVFIVDEAHALGCLGPFGRGLCAKYGVKPDVLVGTLGKAFGASGAFAAGTKDLRDYFLNRARSFIFTTALPIPVAAAALAAVHISSSSPGESLRFHLADLATYLRDRLGLPPAPLAPPIIPLVVGADQVALEASHQLLSRGFFVQAIRPPTVREGTARLRITLSALHTQQQVTNLASAIDSLHLCDLPLHRTMPSGPSQDQSGELNNNTRLSVAESSPSTIHPLATQPRQGIVLLGTDTGVGKTTVSIGLLHILSSRGSKPVPFKPVETGADPLPLDATRLLSASGRADIPLDIVCPVSYRDPVAAAAATFEQPLTLLGMLAHFRAASLYGTPIVVETAGGLLSPYAPHLTPADFAAALGLPVLLIARNGLGTINHTALAVAEIRRRSLSLLGVLLVTTTVSSTPDQRSNLSLISDATGLEPLGLLPFVDLQTPSKIANALLTGVNLRPILDSLAI
jgi:8-amino-7-oxononanoate synthase